MDLTSSSLPEAAAFASAAAAAGLAKADLAGAWVVAPDLEVTACVCLSLASIASADVFLSDLP